MIGTTRSRNIQLRKLIAADPYRGTPAGPSAQYPCGSWRHIGLGTAWDMRDGFGNIGMLELTSATKYASARPDPIFLQEIHSTEKLQTLLFGIKLLKFKQSSSLMIQAIKGENCKMKNGSLHSYKQDTKYSDTKRSRI